MNIIELVRQADPGFEFRSSGALADCLVGFDAIERFAALVRNATLDEAAVEFENETTQSGENIANAIRQLKETK